MLVMFAIVFIAVMAILFVLVDRLKAKDWLVSFVAFLELLMFGFSLVSIIKMIFDFL